MKNITSLICLLIFAILLTSCASKEISTATPTSLPLSSKVNTPTNTHVVETLVPTALLDNKVFPQRTTTVAANTPTISPETRLQFQCLELVEKPPEKTNLQGIVVLKSTVVTDDGRRSRDTFLLDMATDNTVSIAEPNKNQVGHIVSPDGKLLAYNSALLDSSGNIEQIDLVIALADGQRLKTIPWSKGWVEIAGWLDNQRLVINNTFAKK